MTTRNQRIALSFAVVCMLGNDECASEAQAPPAPPAPRDPFTDADLRIAQKLDLGRTYGAVVNKRTEYYVEAHKDFDVKPGNTYYCLDVRQKNADGQAMDIAYCGVPQTVYDAVEIATSLPIVRIHTVYEIAQFNGRVIDRHADPANRAWYITVDHATKVEEYRVDPVSYYRYLEHGQDLPFTPPRGGGTTSASSRNPEPPAVP
ncbi:hypothetical protein HY480_00610 [Candidatus Uhrbacteria bacterium]|nr:hypothetical protein [Candidatus Uhrbacteria bacterium]